MGIVAVALAGDDERVDDRVAMAGGEREPTKSCRCVTSILAFPEVSLTVKSWTNSKIGLTSNLARFVELRGQQYACSQVVSNERSITWYAQLAEVPDRTPRH